MRETHVPLESVWERLVRAVKEGSKQPSKSLKCSKLRRTSNFTFLKSGLKLHTQKQWWRYSLRTIEYATNTNSGILLLSPPYWKWSYHNATQSECAHRLVLTDMWSFCSQKCGPRPKLFLRLNIFSTFRAVHSLIFPYLPHILLLA